MNSVEKDWIQNSEVSTITIQDNSPGISSQRNAIEVVVASWTMRSSRAAGTKKTNVARYFGLHALLLVGIRFRWRATWLVVQTHKLLAEKPTFCPIDYLSLAFITMSARSNGTSILVVSLWFSTDLQFEQ